MGCGISTLDAEDAPHTRRSKAHPHAIVPPVIDKKKEFKNGDESYDGLLHRNNNNNKKKKRKKDVIMIMKPLGDEEAKDEGSNGERFMKEKKVVERKNEEEMVFEIGGKENHVGDDKYAKNNVEEEHEDQYDSFIGPGSPSFREYCNDYDIRSSGDSNDCDSMESIKNGSDDSSIRMNKPKKEGNVNSDKKECEKKERKGRGFRNVKNKAKTRGRRNLLNFACYNASNESYADSSFNKIVAKTA